MTAREARLLLLFFLLPAVLFFHPMLAGKVFIAGDIRFSFHPWLIHAAQTLQAGEFPLWNPYTACGEPFFANPQTLLFLPTAALFWLFPFAAAWPLFVLLNQVLLFLVFYLLARRRIAPGPALLAATAAAWSGAVLVLLEFPSVGATLPWAVAFFLLSLAGAGPASALAAALLFFGGYAHFAYYAVMAAGLGVLVRSVKRRRVDWRGPIVWGTAVGLGLLMWLPQILTSAEAARGSARAAMSAEEMHAFTLTPAFFIKFLIPEIFDKVALPFRTGVFDARLWPLQRNWLNTLFLGVPPFLLALTALRRRSDGAVWAAAGLGGLFASIALAVGPVVDVLRAVAPGFRYMTHFSNAAIGAVFALAYMAGEGMARFRRGDPIFWAFWGTALALCAAEGASPALRETTLRALLGVDTLTAAQHGWVAAKNLGAAAAVGAAGAALLLPVRGRCPAVLLLTLGGLWVFGRDLHPWAPAGFYHAPAPLAELARNIPERLAFTPEAMRQAPGLAGGNIVDGYQSDRQTLRPSQSLPFRVPFAWGYEVMPQRAFTEFRRTIVLNGASPPLDFAGGRYLVSVSTLPAPYKLLMRRENALLYENPGAHARVGWTPRTVVIPEKDERLSYLSSKWNPAAETITEELFPGANDAKTVVAPAWKEGRGRLEARGAGAGWLTYSQIYYPGWDVYVNGAREKRWRANHAFQAVRTPAGPWRADFVYRPATFRWGLAGTLAGLFLTGFWFWREGRRRISSL